MKLRLGTILDRSLAVGLGIFIFILIPLVIGQHQGVFGFLAALPIGLAAATPPVALLWLSKEWSLFLFALIGLPWGYGAYVICDIAHTGSATDLLHLAHDSWLWWIAYGVVRVVICIFETAIENYRTPEKHWP